MNRTKIEWTDWTWNPLTGCKGNCSYCYAKRIRHRFNPDIPWEQLMWFDERWEQPLKVKNPSKIFVGSMSDIYYWRYIDIIRLIEIIEKCPQHTFQLLTKSPFMYRDYNFPKNCWLGVTIDYPSQEKINHLKMKWNYKFISFEPLLGNMSKLDLSGIDLCIIGRDTSPGAVRPKQEWIDSVKHDNIFLKGNLK